MTVPSQAERVEKAHKILDPANGYDSMQQQIWLETAPISPPHGIFADSMATRKSPPRSISEDQTNLPFDKMKITDVLDKIAFIKFRPVQNNTEGQLGAITFSTTLARDLPHAPDRRGLIPCWFLPWQSAKIIQFSIPDVATHPQFAPGLYDPIDNPCLFFTAAINGCSVFAYGDPRSPRVAHAGINPKLHESMKAADFQSLGGNSTDVWRNLLEGIKLGPGNTVVPKTAAEHKHGTLKQNRVGGSFGEVDRTQYVSRPKTGTLDFEAVTNESERFERYLAASRQDHVTQAMVIPFGCVFGMRNAGGTWSFTLQRNACVAYHRVFKKKGGLFSKSKTVSHGPDKSAPALKFYSAVNLGFTRFFPTPPYVHYHAQAHVQIY